MLSIPILVCAIAAETQPGARFSFAPYLEAQDTLSIGSVVVEGDTVTVHGNDAARPREPFVFDWGDTTTSESRSPATHTYDDTTCNYEIRVTAKHGTKTETAAALVRFLPVDWSYKRRPDVQLTVQIPDKDTKLGTTMPGYDPPADVSCLSDKDLGGARRDAIEYVLSVAKQIQTDFCNQNVTDAASGRQVVLKQTSFAGCASLWFTDPPSFVCHPGYFEGDIGFSSLFHELAHNLTLNSPARFRFGGRTDGPTSAIISESLANIFQHATIYEILNAKDRYGLSDDVRRMIRDDGIRSITVVRGAYRKLAADPSKYTTYDDPATDEDDTFSSFMTVAYVFIEEAEKRGDYRGPLKRMMRLLHTFCESDLARCRDRADETFRATFVVVALSYGFDTDLRPRFHAVGFPISDDLYGEIMGRTTQADAPASSGHGARVDDAGASA